MAKKVLVLYYSQSGQLKQILDNITSSMGSNIEVDHAEIKPVQPFPMPWKVSSFFDAMPECVELVPSPVQPIAQEILDKDYDLILFGYQPWFLSPSQPTTSFLKSEYARVLKGKPVVTVIGARNMWLNAQEKVKQMLLDKDARLVGSIALVDSNTNIISTLTVLRWAFKGQKEPSRFLPEAGVQSKDIAAAERFGQPIATHLLNNDLESLHSTLLKHNSVEIKPGLVVLENRGIKNFRKFAKYIREKGGPGAPERLPRVNLFKRLLITGIFVLSPISSFTATIQKQLQRRKLKDDVAYFRGISFEPERI